MKMKIVWGNKQLFKAEGISDTLWQDLQYGAYKEEIIDEEGVEVIYFISTPKIMKSFKTEQELSEYLRASK